MSLWKTLLVIALLGVLGFAGWRHLNAPDTRTPGERFGEAIDALSEGANKAADQLKDKTAADRAKDAVDDAAKKIQEQIK